MPRPRCLRQGRHADDAASLLFDKTAQIGKRAAKTDMVITKQIIRTSHDITGEYRRRDQAVPTIGARMTNLVRLNDSSGSNRKPKMRRKRMRHRIGDCIKPCRPVGGDCQQDWLTACQKVAKTIHRLGGEQLLHKRLGRLGVA